MNIRTRGVVVRKYIRQTQHGSEIVAVTYRWNTGKESTKWFIPPLENGYTIEYVREDLSS